MTVATPVATPVTTPVALTLAIFVSDELQVAEEVRSFVEPSEYDPVAWSETVTAATMAMAFGETERPLSEAGTGCPPEPGWPPEFNWFLTPLQAARNTQNERMQILSRKYFLRKVQSRLNPILFEAPTTVLGTCRNGWHSKLRCS